MSGTTLFVGTSFLGAVCQGWKELSPEHEAVFLGLDGPTLACHLRSGWRVEDGELRLAEDLPAFLLDPELGTGVQGNRTFAGFERTSGLRLDLRRFSRLVLVDMFFNPGQPVIVDSSGAMMLGEIPISDHALSILKRPGLNGWMRLVDHPRLGTTDWASTVPMIMALRKAMGDAETLLVSRPRPPRANRPASGMLADITRRRASFEAMEAHFDRFLAERGIGYLHQPEGVLDEDRCYTQDRFSRGPHASSEGKLDPHMNAEYGKLIVKELLATFAEAPEKATA